MKNKYAVILFVVLAFYAFSGAFAQLNPMGAQFYMNQYLGNPAMAGLDSGLNLSAGFRRQMASIPGGPQNQSLTAEYRFNRVGVGLNFYNEKSGIKKDTRVLATYAYHLLLNNNNQLHFGLSMGFLNERINENEIIGNVGDASVSALNRRETYIDGDFGMAFTSNRLTVQGSVPNLKSVLNRDSRNTADQSVFYSSVSYKFPVGQGMNGIVFEPKLSYRGVKGYDNLWDLGTNVSFLNNMITAFGMYHDTKSATFGFGALTVNRTLAIQAIYTTETAALRHQTNGNFEISLRYRLL